MKPIQTLLFLLGIFALLSLIVLVFPKDGLELTSDIKLIFPTFTEIFSPDEPDAVDISALTADSINTGLKKNIASKPASAKADTLIDPKFLQYPSGDVSVLHPFFAQLDSIKIDKRQIRVVHYGDSQLEEDRISSFVREELQQTFGGWGPGLISPQPLAQSISILQSDSDNWERFAIYSADDKAEHRRYGVLASFARYGGTSAYLKLRQSPFAYDRSKAFTKCTLLYGFNPASVKAELLFDGKPRASKTLKSSNHLQVATWMLDSIPNDLTIKFSGGGSPDVYAVALDGDAGGVAVDNVPMRGAAGTIFAGLDSTLLGESYDTLGVKLLILQYGGNAMPTGSPEQAARFGEKFCTHLKALRTLRPQIPMIVIGLADMSKKVKGKLQSYPYIENMRDALRKAAFDAGAAYWDMFGAMGGRNSMPVWVKSKPPLAGPDYVHFTRKGAEKISGLFYTALMKDYNSYRRTLVKSDTTVTAFDATKK
ncbi:MAG: hypothetical protein IAF08_07345 [Rhizobacter sp.]|nr:hypothetical protein [Chlorobiales bacterium]